MAIPDTVYVQVKVGGVAAPYVTSIQVKSKVNSSRTVTLKVADDEGLTQLKLGSKIEVNVGIGTNTWINFTGQIRMIQPGNPSTIVATDYIHNLRTSENIYKRPQDHIFSDLYYAAKDACNISEIDTTRLTVGANLNTTPDMPLWGWQTRKKFLDGCISLMVEPIDDDDHPENTYLPWYYAIHYDNVMDFFQPDHLDSNPRSLITVSEAKQNLINESLTSSISTDTLINSCTVISQQDEATYYTYEDSDSIQKYGEVSKLIKWDSIDRNVLYEVARRNVERFKSPSISYAVDVIMNEWLPLGSLIELDIGDKSVVLPIVESSLTIDNGVVASYTVGEPRISFANLTKLLIEEL
jgi:hypothetical protein